MTIDALTQRPDHPDGDASPDGASWDATRTDPSTEVRQLRSALVTNRRIGLAMGMVMCAEDVGEDQAFALLRHLSQHANRKLRDVAEDVITRRGLPLLPHLKPSRAAQHPAANGSYLPEGTSASVDRRGRLDGWAVDVTSGQEG